MKTLLIFLVSALPFLVSAQNKDAAIAYNDYLVDLQNRIGSKILIMNSEVGKEGSTLETAMVYLNDAIKETRDVIKLAEKVSDFEGNVSLRNSMLALFRYYERVFSVEYKRMIEIVYDPNLDDAMLEEMNVILTRVTEEEKVLDLKFAEEQTNFAKRYGFDLTPNELQEEMDGE